MAPGCSAALARTPEQLIVDGVRVLEKAGVVDSGAQGFCYVVEGMLLACRGELADACDAGVFASGGASGEEESIAETYADDHSVESAFQYCTVRHSTRHPSTSRRSTEPDSVCLDLASCYRRRWCT